MALVLKTSRDTEVVKDSDLVADGDKDTTYTIRHLTVPKHRDILKANTKRVINKRTHAKDDEVDDIGFSDALLDYVLIGWSGVMFDGKPVDVNGVVRDGDEDVPAKTLLDGPRRTAMFEKAGLNEIQAASEGRQESFRAPTNDR